MSLLGGNEWRTRPETTRWAWACWTCGKVLSLPSRARIGWSRMERRAGVAIRDLPPSFKGFEKQNKANKVLGLSHFRRLCKEKDRYR